MKQKRKLVQCSTLVKKDAVRRESINGVEHVIISSSTLPDDIVMNGGMYPADEISTSFNTLSRTPAPIGHPQDASGNYISATDPDAIHEYYAGAYNDNVRRENGRVHIDKVVNVVEARKSDRGRRLLDRINELENSESPRPVHTSVGVFVDAEELDAPRVGADNQEYTWIARNMFFDHDAILLDEVGAAQPHQGVGMAVNADGEEVEVMVTEVPAIAEPKPEPEMSSSQLEAALFEAVNTPPLSAEYLEEVFPSHVIYSFNDRFFTVPYTVGNGTVTIAGLPLPVSRETSYEPTTNSKGDAMRELMLNALKDAGISVDADISDGDLLSKYGALNANKNTEESGDDMAAVVANALAPLSQRLEGLEAKLTANNEAEKEGFAEIVGNSDKYQGLTKESAMSLDVESLKSMAANCGGAYGVPTGDPVVNSTQKSNYEMPEG